MGKGLLVIAAMLAVLFAGQAWGELTPEQAKEVEGLIKKCGDDDYATREAATKRLIEMGPEVTPTVKRAMEETKDAETRSRCEKVLAALRMVEKRVASLGKITEGAYNEIVNRDGTRMAWKVKSAGKTEMWCDGKLSGKYDEVPGQGFSGDGKHFAYAARAGKKCFVVKDGEKGPEWDGAKNPAMSPDGARLGYVAETGKKLSVVVDGVAGPKYEQILLDQMTFSADGRRYGYSGQRGGKWHAVVDGVEGPAHDTTGMPTFSGDGSRVAYVAKDGEAWHWIIDGKEEAAARSWTFGIFSADGRHFAYEERAREQKFMVADGKAGRRYDDVQWLAYSPDGERLAYKAITAAGGELVVADDKDGPMFTAIETRPGFSPDGKNLYYTARMGDEWFEVCGGRMGRGYAKISAQAAFSGDGKHLAYVAETGPKKQMIVLDGGEGPAHERCVLPTGCMETAGKLRYVARDGDEAWLMELDLPERVDWKNGMKEMDGR